MVVQVGKTSPPSSCMPVDHIVQGLVPAFTHAVPAFSCICSQFPVPECPMFLLVCAIVPGVCLVLHCVALIIVQVGLEMQWCRQLSI